MSLHTCAVSPVIAVHRLNLVWIEEGVKSDQIPDIVYTIRASFYELNHLTLQFATIDNVFSFQFTMQFHQKLKSFANHLHAILRPTIQGKFNIKIIYMSVLKFLLQLAINKTIKSHNECKFNSKIELISSAFHKNYDRFKRQDKILSVSYSCTGEPRVITLKIRGLKHSEDHKETM